MDTRAVISRTQTRMQAAADPTRPLMRWPAGPGRLHRAGATGPWSCCTAAMEAPDVAMQLGVNTMRPARTAATINPGGGGLVARRLV